MGVFWCVNVCGFVQREFTEHPRVRAKEMAASMKTVTGEKNLPGHAQVGVDMIVTWEASQSNCSGPPESPSSEGGQVISAAQAQLSSQCTIQMSACCFLVQSVPVGAEPCAGEKGRNQGGLCCLSSESSISPEVPCELRTHPLLPWVRWALRLHSPS